MSDRGDIHLLFLIIRKMLSNKWMFLCLLVGSIVVVAMVSSIPIYTDGVLQRMLVKELEDYQTTTGTYSGTYRINSQLYAAYEQDKRATVYKQFDNIISGRLVKEIKLPVISQTRDLIFDNLTAINAVQREAKPKEKYARIDALAGFQDHVKILHGRMFSTDLKDGVFEAVITQRAMQEMGLLLDDIYNVSALVDGAKREVKVKIVGVFDVKDPKDVYWYQNVRVFKGSFIIDYDLATKELVNKPNTPPLTGVQWFFAYDYHKITLKDIPAILSSYETQVRWYNKYKSVLEFTVPLAPTLEKYYEKEKQLKITLWVLLAPILLMLSFYIFMVSQLIINSEENEISVLKSRGASKRQIQLIYFIESLVLSGIAMLVGPPVGLYICKILGASNGFLEFVQRKALPTTLDSKAYIYSLWAVALFIVTMLIPVFLHSRITIIQHKQRKGRSGKTVFWKKYFMDFILLAVSGYGLYDFHSKQLTLKLSGLKGTDLSISPLLFLTSTLFILGVGLFFLRIYPYIIRFIFWLGRKVWSPVFYVSFIQVGRSSGQEQFLMLFIILALSIGLFSANAARTLNKNMEDKIRYENGADVTIQAKWMDNKVTAVGGTPPQMGSQGTGLSSTSGSEPVKYIEPPFDPYTKLPGVDKITKVFVNDNVQVRFGDSVITNIKMLGIIPNEFGKVAWFRNDLLPHHWYDYLNLIVDSPKAMLLSRSFQKDYKLKVGDSIMILWGEDYVEGTVYAFIDYWPTFNPNLKSETNIPANLIVCNLPYLQNVLPVEPYQVWIKKKPGAADADINKALGAKEFDIVDVQYANQKVIVKKNDPMLQGTNGALTLGFVVTMLISTIGFIIYWIIAIRNRALHFGIFRAMGLSLRNVMGMIVFEQVLISGTAIGLGVFVGSITSKYFVPLLQMAYSSAEQVPPFKVISYASDYIKIYSVIVFMLLIGLGVISTIISRIKVNQALKLGED